MDELKKEREKLEEKDKELREVEHEYMDFMRNVSKHGRNITKIGSVNMYFVVDEYDEAFNYEDRMKRPITKKEKAGIIKYGGVQGCFDILFNRCIKGISVDKRPFHCVDASRSKYMLRTKNKWQVDRNAKMILEGIYPRVVQICVPKQMKDISELPRYQAENKRMIELANGKNKILKKLNEVSLLKNNTITNK